MSNIKKNYILNLIYEVYALLIPVIIIPYASRVLSSDGLGVYTFSQSISYYFILLGCLGFTIYARREFAKNRDNPEELNVIFWETIISRAITIIVSIGLYFLLVVLFYKDTHYEIHLLILSLSIIGHLFDVVFCFQGLEKFQTIIIKDFIVKTLFIVSIFLFVKQKDDLWIYTLLQAGMIFVSSIMLWVRIPKFIFKKPTKKLNLKRCLKPSMMLFVPAVASTIYTVFDKTLIGLLVKETVVDPQTGEVVKVADIENGMYDNTERIVKMLITILTSLNVIVAPRNSYYYKTGQMEKIRENQEKSISFVFLLGAPMVFGIIAVASIFCPLYFGDGFEKTPQLIRILSPLILFIGVSGVYGMQYLTALGKDKQYILSVCIGSLINVSLNLILIPLLYGTGAAIATVIAEFCIASLMVFFVRKEIAISYILKAAAKYILVGAVMFGCIFPLQYIIHNQILSLAVMVLSGLVIYITILTLIKDKFIFAIYKKVHHVFTRKKVSVNE